MVKERIQYNEKIIDCTANQHETYIECNFDDVTFTGVINVTIFQNCSFRNVTFCTVSDVTFKFCTLHEITFQSRINDSTFSKCTLTDITGKWNNLRCQFDHCVIAKAVFTLGSSFELCKLLNVRMLDSVMELCHFVDVECMACHFSEVNMRRMDSRRCHFTKTEFLNCLLTSSSFAGNNWMKCIFSLCNDSYSRHLSESHKRTLFHKISSVRAQLIQCRYANCIRRDHDYLRSQWEHCVHTNCKWYDVNLNESILVDVEYNNRVKHNLTVKDATFTNTAQQYKPHVACEVHFKEEMPVIVNLYAQHVLIGTFKSKYFRLSAATACGVDFIDVKCVPGWFTFNFSTPDNAYHLVSHITIGKKLFYPTRKSYFTEDGQEKNGYSHMNLKKSHSSPCLLHYIDDQTKIYHEEQAPSETEEVEDAVAEDAEDAVEA